MTLPVVERRCLRFPVYQRWHPGMVDCSQARKVRYLYHYRLCSICIMSFVTVLLGNSSCIATVCYDVYIVHVLVPCCFVRYPVTSWTAPVGIAM